jgi:type IV pilus assembly protein PilM
MAKRIVGLDIGRDTVRAVEVENADKARPTVSRVYEVPVPEDAVQSGEVREIHTVTSAIKRLWSTGGFRTKDVVIGMGNQRVLARDLTLPRMSLSQIRESLPFQVQDMLPVPVHDALLDFYPISEGIGENGPVVNGLLIAAIKDSVMANVKAVSEAGLNVVQVDLIPFALSRVLIRGPLLRGTVALIDIGASTTNVVVTTEGVPQFVRMIPAGGADVTKALVARMEISPEQAEGFKRSRGLTSAAPASEQERAAAEIIHTSTSDLLNSLRNTLTYFSNTRQNDPVLTIVLTGGGSQLQGFAQALGDITRIPITPADPFDSLDLSRTVKKSDARERQTLTVALGLALGSVA